jgi:hypothetical protein
MKQLITWLGWVPVLGDSLKLAYISKCSYEVAAKLKLPAEKAEGNAEELEKHLSEYSEAAFNEHIQPLFNEINLPEFVKEKAKEKSLEIFNAKLKNKYLSETSS